MGHGGTPIAYSFGGGMPGGGIPGGGAICGTKVGALKGWGRRTGPLNWSPAAAVGLWTRTGGGTGTDGTGEETNWGGRGSSSGRGGDTMLGITDGTKLTGGEVGDTSAEPTGTAGTG